MMQTAIRSHLPVLEVPAKSQPELGPLQVPERYLPKEINLNIQSLLSWTNPHQSVFVLLSFGCLCFHFSVVFSSGKIHKTGKARLYPILVVPTVLNPLPVVPKSCFNFQQNQIECCTCNRVRAMEWSRINNTVRLCQGDEIVKFIKTAIILLSASTTGTSLGYVKTCLP